MLQHRRSLLRGRPRVLFSPSFPARANVPNIPNVVLNHPQPTAAQRGLEETGNEEEEADEDEATRLNMETGATGSGSYTEPLIPLLHLTQQDNDCHATSRQLPMQPPHASRVGSCASGEANNNQMYDNNPDGDGDTEDDEELASLQESGDDDGKGDGQISGRKDTTVHPGKLEDESDQPYHSSSSWSWSSLGSSANEDDKDEFLGWILKNPRANREPPPRHIHTTAKMRCITGQPNKKKQTKTSEQKLHETAEEARENGDYTRRGSLSLGNRDYGDDGDDEFKPKRIDAKRSYNGQHPTSKSAKNGEKKWRDELSHLPDDIRAHYIERRQERLAHFRIVDAYELHTEDVIWI
ncbi:hypothetical protein CPB86DRAFT_785816 [Serendipita vermifera]|nr:hypothetical protein CPB86DRAFT_785816 [Serendipita vermifera]